MQNTKNPLLSACIVLTVAVTLMSGWLTLKFFHGDGSTFESYVLGGIGVVLDSVKVIAPMIALYLWGRGNHVLAVLGGAFALLLCMISFVASVASLEKNVVKTQDSVEISQIDNQIKRHEALYEEHMAQYERRVAITYITDGDKSLMEAQKISEKIEQLTEEKKALAEGATVVKYGNQISVGASALIEIASVFLSVAMYYLRQDEKNALKPSDPQVNAASFSEEDRALILGLIGQVGNFREEIDTLKNAKVPETIEVAQSSQVAMSAAEAIVSSDLQEIAVETAPTQETISENVDIHKSDDVTESSSSNVVSPDFQKAIASSNSEEVETTKVHEESTQKSLGTDGDNGAKTILLSQKHKKIVEELRQKILDEEVEPSVRGVDSITTNRVLIRNTFEKMLADGELVRKGRGYALAA